MWSQWNAEPSRHALLQLNDSYSLDIKSSNSVLNLSFRKPCLAELLFYIKLLIVMVLRYFDNYDDVGMSQQQKRCDSDSRSWATVELVHRLPLPSLLPATRKSSSKLCYLIWAFCAMCAASRGLVGRLCKHSVAGSTHVYLLKHQSHTEAVKEARRRLTAHTMGADLWHRFQMQSQLGKSNGKMKQQSVLARRVTSERIQIV